MTGTSPWLIGNKKLGREVVNDDGDPLGADWIKIKMDANKRVLVIDDNRSIHDDFRKILQVKARDEGFAQARAALFGDSPLSEVLEQFDLDCADQGQAALTMVRLARNEGRPYAVAFVDMRMPPGWDGLETIEHLWKEDAELQVVICTAYTDHSWEDIVRRLGHDDRLLILQKPFFSIEVSQVATSLTGKWNLARQARESLEAAQAAILEKSQFLSNMSHEIRTPMHGILGMSELLLQTPLNDTQRKFAETIHCSGTALLDIINDILDFSKAESGKLELERIRFDLRKTVKEVMDLFVESAHGKAIELVCDLSDSIPPVFKGDPVRLRQILINLVSNAVKFTDRGQVVVRVAIAEDSLSHETVRFEIQDSGIGIEEAVQAKIFESFSQADGSTTRKYGGTGLGLAIVKQLVHCMEGTVGVRSALGEGATFWFTARLEKVLGQTREGQQKCAERQDASQADAAPRIPGQVLAGTRILLAEDNPVNQDVAIEMLRVLGCDVDAVEQGQEAVAAVQARRYDLVLMDCQMPVMDGLVASQAIRAGECGSHRHVPIVALTASAMKGDRERCLEAGMDDYLSKPYTQATLQDIVCRWITAGDRPIREATVNLDSGAVPEVKDVRGAVVRGGPKAGMRSNEPAGCLEQAAIQALMSLNRPGGPDVCRRLITVYLNSSMATMAVLRHAVAASNADGIFQAAHSLKSSSAMFGGLRLADLLKQLEAAGKSGRLEPVAALQASAELEYDLLSRALQDHQSESAA